MKAIIKKEDLVRSVTLCERVADARSTMPILESILISGKDEQLTCSACDLTTEISAVCEATIDKPGTIAVNASHAARIIKAMSGEYVTLETGKNERLGIQSGTASYHLAGHAGADFPKLNTPNVVEFPPILNADRLAALLSQTIFSVCTDETRSHLNGVFLHNGDGKITAVSTDGHRLSLARAQSEAIKSLKDGILIPRKAALEIVRLPDLDEGEVVLANGRLSVFIGTNIVLTCKLIDSKFPPYQQVVPKHTVAATVDREQFANALRRLSLVANDVHGVKLIVDTDALRLESGADVQSGQEVLDCEYSGKSLTIGFNARYLSEAISRISSDRVRLELGGELDPGVVCPIGDGDEFRGVVMPMRV